MRSITVSALYAIASFVLLLSCAVTVGRPRQHDFAIMFAMGAALFGWVSGIHFADWASERRGEDVDQPVD